MNDRMLLRINDRKTGRLGDVFYECNEWAQLV